MKKTFAFLLCAILIALSVCSCVGPVKKSTAAQTASEPVPKTSGQAQSSPKPDPKTSGQAQSVIDEATELLGEGRKLDAALLLWENRNADGTLGLFKTFAERAATRFVYTNRDGEKTVYNYEIDEKGLLKTEKNTYPGGEVLTYEYVYENDLPVRVTMIMADGGRNETEIVYDAAGNRLKTTETYSDGAVEINEYTYDPAGRNLSQKTVSIDGTVLLRTCEYDSLGRIVKDTFVDHSGDTSVWECEYTGESRTPSRETYTDTDGTVTVTNRTLGANGETLSETCTYSDGTSSRTVNEYDASGRLIKSVRFTADGDELTSTFEYDAEGRRVRSLEAEDYGVVETVCVYSSEGDLLKETITYPEGETEISEYSDYKVIMKRRY